MGLVSKQAYKNTLSISLGIIAGAINTVFILPRAFEEAPEDWGLVSILLANAIIFAQIFGFGTFNIVIRDYFKYKSAQKKEALLGFGLLLSLVGIGLLVFIFFLGKPIFPSLFNHKDLAVLYNHIFIFFSLAAVLILNQFFSGFLVAKHKTPVVQFVNELVLKTSYLILALVYWLKPFSFENYLLLFTGTYLISFLVYVSYAVYLDFRINFKIRFLNIKELLIYGGYTILDKGAGIIVGKLDLIMISILLDLENVAYYILAFYMGTVITMPQRALLQPTIPLVSDFIQKNAWGKIKELYRQTSINQLIAGGVLFILIWLNIEALYQWIPAKFSGGMWVVFYIALSKLALLAIGVGGPIIIYSKYYRINLVFNVFLILLTIVSNYILIPIYGITGAALATAITYFVYTLLRIIFIKKKYSISPFTFDTVKVIGLFALIFFLDYWFAWPEWPPIISIGVKSILAGVIMGGGFWVLRVKAEILSLAYGFLGLKTKV